MLALDTCANHPILVTGVSRSGTTWVGKVLSLSKATRYCYEPFNPDVKKSILNWRFQPLGCKQKFSHVSESSCPEIRFRFRLLLKFLQLDGKRPLIKDPIAALASKWISDDFNASVVITLRHPAGVAASRLRLGWEFDFKHFFAQRGLFSRSLNQVVSQCQQFYDRNRRQDIVADSAWLWRIVYTYLMEQSHRHRNWHLLRHEDLCQDPVRIFSHLYDALGLQFHDQIKDAIIDQTQAIDVDSDQSLPQHAHRRCSRKIPTGWKDCLTSSQVSKIQEIAGPLGEALYPKACW